MSIFLIEVITIAITFISLLFLVINTIALIFKTITEVRHLHKINLDIKNISFFKGKGIRFPYINESNIITNVRLKKEDIIYIATSSRKKPLYFYLEKENSKDDVSNTNKEKYSIVEEIYNKKKKQYVYAIVILAISASIYCCMDIFFNFDFHFEILLFFYALIGLIAILNVLVSYRIKKGYYGTNYEESKEILYYMTEDKDKNNINPGKRIFNDIDVYNKVREQIPEDGELQY